MGALHKVSIRAHFWFTWLYPTLFWSTRPRISGKCGTAVGGSA